MVALYNLYDKYYFLTINYIPYPYTLCSMIDEASGIFNDTINVHGDKDKNLLTRLKVFKPLMDNIVPKFTCSSNYRKHFIIPERFSDNKVTKPENQEQKEESSEHPLVSPDEHEKQQIIDSPGQSRNSEVNLHSETVTLERVTEASGNSRLVTGTSSQEDLDIYVQLSHSLDGRHAVEGDLLNVSHLQEGEYTDPLKDPTRLNLRGHPSAKETLGLQYTVGQQIEDPSLLGKMRTALSTMVDSVDPGPVLGVSGGMGVLFLLFKYTPVGSFFGGRRGRFRQIPRIFGGFPPGDFGYFQEYGGGYVGYSQMDMPFQGE
ncbi:hypothetical protein PVNG_06181 [Plasmodium vivax North Korean]|uniref:Uncharacterized protein n=1 Tax=Plasmodium vivax North Korean TaxID=1035514 RepID=A0A0J9U008_PLAVI|nr:hypothetical protein PVNG_06181 [Plasmodium vivax North Korean]